MNYIVARNVRARREQAGMTQEQMADGCKVNVRTIQRIEQGQPHSEDALERIAAVLECSIVELRFDFVAYVAQTFGVAPEAVTADFIESKAAEARKEFDVIELQPVTTAAAFAVFANVEALHVDCRITDDAIRDVAAELQQDLMDGIDIHSEMPPVRVREYERHLFTYVTRLKDLGARVFARPHEMRLKVGPDPSPMRMTVLLVCITNEESAFHVIDKKQPIRFAL